MSTHVKPEQITITGEITNVSEIINKNGKDFRMVTLSTPSGSKAYPINAKFYARNQSLMAIGSACALTFDRNIAGTTQYVDKAGVVQNHTTTGEAIASVRTATKREILTSYEDRFTDDMSQTKATGLGLLYGNALRA